MILDAIGHCLLWNPAAEHIFGWREDEVLGRPLPTVAPEQSDEHRSLRELVMKDEAFTDLEVVRYKKDGTPVYISLSTAPFRDSSGTICGVLGLMADMTQRKQIGLELSHSRDQLRALATRLVSVREEEGTRIAREVHDELGQAMTSLKLDLSWMARRLSIPETVVSREQLLERVQGTMQLLEVTIQTVRAIATALRPAVLDELGLAAALDWQTRDFEKRTGIRCEWSMPLTPIPIGPDRPRRSFASTRRFSPTWCVMPRPPTSVSIWTFPLTGSFSKCAITGEVCRTLSTPTNIPWGCSGCENGLHSGEATSRSLGLREWGRR